MSDQAINIDPEDTKTFRSDLPPLVKCDLSFLGLDTILTQKLKIHLVVQTVGDFVDIFKKTIRIGKLVKDGIISRETLVQIIGALSAHGLIDED